MDNKKLDTVCRWGIIISAIVFVLAIPFAVYLAEKDNIVETDLFDDIEDDEEIIEYDEESDDYFVIGGLIYTGGEKEDKDLLEIFRINDETIDDYSDYVKYDVVYNYLMDSNTYEYYTCEDLLKDEINNWGKWENDEGYYSQDGYYCGTGTYVIPFNEFNDTFSKLYNKRIEKKSFAFYHYLKSLDGFAYLPYIDGTNGPSVRINHINKITRNNNLIEYEFYSENLICESYEQNKLINCGNDYFKESGTDEEIREKVIKEHLSNVKLYKIVFKDNTDYKTLISIKNS